MCRGCNFLKFLRLVFLVIAIGWLGVLAGAQQKPSRTPGPGPGQTTITDAAGRVHVRNPRITDAQRKAVAARMKAARIKAAAKKAK